MLACESRDRESESDAPFRDALHEPSQLTFQKAYLAFSPINQAGLAAKIVQIDAYSTLSNMTAFQAYHYNKKSMGPRISKAWHASGSDLLSCSFAVLDKIVCKASVHQNSRNTEFYLGILFAQKIQCSLAGCLLRAPQQETRLRVSGYRNCLPSSSDNNLTVRVERRIDCRKHSQQAMSFKRCSCIVAENGLMKS